MRITNYEFGWWIRAVLVTKQFIGGKTGSVYIEQAHEQVYQVGNQM